MNRIQRYLARQNEVPDLMFVSSQLWSKSVQDNPAGYPLGFIVCSCACGLAILHSFFIR